MGCHSNEYFAYNHAQISRGEPERCFIDVTVSGFVTAGEEIRNGTNVFINRDKITEGITKTANFTLQTTAETKVQSNFTNFDFVNIWQIEDGVTTP